MNTNNIYEQSLDKNQANFAHLTPLSFIERSARVYPNKISLIHGDTEYTWSQTYKRCCLLASALKKMGKLAKGDRFVLTAGLPFSGRKATNMVRADEVG